MSKRELIDRIHQDLKFRRLTKAYIEDLIEVTVKLITNSVTTQGRFTYPRFGSFVLRQRQARIGRNPQTGVKLHIGTRKAVLFKAAAHLKQSVG